MYFKKDYTLKIDKSILDGAIFIADVHYNYKRKEFELFLKKLFDNPPPQLFLLGDIFDFLSNEIDYFKKINKPLIDLINKLSKKTKIYYFEGNHDFNLKNLFCEKIYIYPISNQPQIFFYKNKKIALSHGDIYSDFSYKLYTSFIRNSFILKTINFFDFNNFISKYFEKKLSNKQICNKKNLSLNYRIDLYEEIDLVIEGHFHEEILTNDYINLPAFACGEKYLTLTSGKFKFI